MQRRRRECRDSRASLPRLQKHKHRGRRRVEEGWGAISSWGAGAKRRFPEALKTSEKLPYCTLRTSLLAPRMLPFKLEDPGFQGACRRCWLRLLRTATATSRDLTSIAKAAAWELVSWDSDRLLDLVTSETWVQFSPHPQPFPIQLSSHTQVATLDRISSSEILSCARRRECRACMGWGVKGSPRWDVPRLLLHETILCFAILYYLALYCTRTI